MGSKVSELNSLTTTEYSKLEDGLIPVVIEDSLGAKHNKKFTLLEYWTHILQAKVAAECEKHKSIYNFGGEVIDSGGGSSSGEEGGGQSSEDWIALTTRVQSLETFRDTTAPNTYYPKSSGDQLSLDFNSFKTTQETRNANTQTTLTSYATRLGSLESKTQTKLIIKVVDREGNLVRGYSYSPDEGLNSNVIEFPAGNYIQLRTDELARAMYHLELATAVTAVYSVENGRYAITIGPLQLTTPTSGVTQYTGGAITDAYIDITPSWDATSVVHQDLALNNGIVGTYNFTWYYPSSTDQLTGSNSFNIQIKIGNWSQTFNLTNNMTITGNISTDITAAQ